MNPSKRSVTLDNFIEAESKALNVLCKTHADRLKMPKGWLLDDRREANPRLFRVAASVEQKPARDHTAGHRRKSRPFPKPESFDTVPTPRPIEVREPEPKTEPELVVELIVEPETVVDEDPIVAESNEMPEPLAAEPELEPTQAMPWRPHFDQEDDLDGVLKPKGRLLSRAFGSDETQFMQRPPKDLQREPFDDIP